jgi:hypothetical protein
MVAAPWETLRQPDGQSDVDSVPPVEVEAAPPNRKFLTIIAAEPKGTRQRRSVRAAEPQVPHHHRRRTEWRTSLRPRIDMRLSVRRPE